MKECQFIEFAYRAIGLPDLQESEYIELDDPLAVGLSALTRPREGSRVLRKLRAMERLSRSGLDEGRAWLLASVINNYLKLSESEEKEMGQTVEEGRIALQARYERWLAAKEADFERARQEGLARGLQEGLEQGREQGLEQGREQGLIRGLDKGLETGLEKGLQAGLKGGRHDVLLRLITRRFGAPSTAVVSAIEAITDTDALVTLVEKAATAHSIDELGLV